MRCWQKLFAVAVVMMAGSVASAQTYITVTADSGSTADITINLTMTLQGAVVLRLEGNPVAPSTSFTGITYATTPASADVNFGTVDTACSATPTTGQCIRMTNAAGANFVATVDATVTVSGVSTGHAKIGISAPTPTTGVAKQSYRICGASGANGSCPSTTPDPFWQDTANGIPIPNTGASNTQELGQDIDSGLIVEHQLGVQVLDVTDTINDVVVTYVAGADMVLGP